MAVNDYKYISAKVAIRNALGNLGYGGVEIQTMEPDMIRWTAEAQDLIMSNIKSLPLVEEKFIVYNNQIQNNPDFYKVENLKLQGNNIYPDRRSKSSPYVSMGTPRIPSVSHPDGVSYRANKYNITFTPNVPDGTEGSLQYLCKPVDEEGYPMIIDSCARAIGLYVGTQLCKRLKDNRFDNEKKEWLFACRQARASVNEMSEEQLMAIGQAYIGFGHRQCYGYGLYGY